MTQILVSLLFVVSFNLSAYTVWFVAENYSPLHFISDRGAPDGALVEVASLMLDKAELAGHIDIVPQARAVQLAHGDKHVVLMSLLRTPEREHEYCWLGESIAISGVLIARADTDFVDTSLSPQKHTVATVRGYHSETYLKKLGFKEESTLVLVKDDFALWQALVKGRSQFILTSNLLLETKLEAYGIDKKQIKLIKIVSDIPGRLYFAMDKDCNKDVSEKLSNALNQLKQSGQYQAIIQRWQLQ